MEKFKDKKNNWKNSYGFGKVNELIENEQWISPGKGQNLE